ncbi:hypothetical protein WJT86_04975 [Microvirga sp. W0021]|uniref:Uncharacterized protein n=1 Tax=Hohaiivirga grylli TaxID=3133970 RepID=A0ABV0BJG1_9HYPH
MFIALATILYISSFAAFGSGAYIFFVILGYGKFYLEQDLASFLTGFGLMMFALVMFGMATLILCFDKLGKIVKTVAAQNQMNVTAVTAANSAVQSEPLDIPVYDYLRPTQPVSNGVSDFEYPASSYSDEQVTEKADEVSQPLEETIVAEESLAVETESSIEPKVRESAFGFYSYSREDDVRENEPEIRDVGTQAVEAAALEETDVSEEPVISEAAVEEDTPVAAAESAKADEAVTVIGSYESGGNRYVMYSDGSIEAHLPTGLRTFNSLNELKQFVSGSAVSA